MLGKGQLPHQVWVGIMVDANSITNVAWGASVNASPSDSPWSPINLRATQRHIRGDFLHCRCQERLWRHYNLRYPLVNNQVHCRDYDRDSPVMQ